jgi:non-ribosomal peptide synthetase component E (peptide arylation enzyme)
MIADRIHLVALLPRTGNGKVDRAALAGMISCASPAER